MNGHEMDSAGWNASIQEVIDLVGNALRRLDTLGAPADIGALLDQAFHALKGQIRD